MNIHVVRPDGSWYSRPDVTLVRDADRFCLPDDCTGAQACHAICVRIEKSGKAIAPAFAHRYFNSFAQSILFYGIAQNGSPTPFLDRATWVNRTFHSTDTLAADVQDRIDQALCRISRYLSLRIGDYLIFESAAPTLLKRGDLIDNIVVL